MDRSAHSLRTHTSMTRSKETIDTLHQSSPHNGYRIKDVITRGI